MRSGRRRTWWVCGALAAAGVLGAPVVAQGALIPTEIMYNPASTDDNSWEFVEIFNSGPSPVDLSGFVLDDDDGGDLTGANIAAGLVPVGGAAVLINAEANTVAAAEAAWGPGINFIAVNPWNDLGNGGDRIALWSSLASYGSRDFGNALFDVDFDDEGDWPTDEGDHSIYLIDLGADPTVGTNWAPSMVGDASGGYASNPAGDNNAVNIGSPGRVVPEPAALGLLATGSVLAMRCRGRARRGR